MDEIVRTVAVRDLLAAGQGQERLGLGRTVVVGAAAILAALDQDRGAAVEGWYSAAGWLGWQARAGGRQWTWAGR